MAKVEMRRVYPKRDSGECYQASLRMIEKAGFQIFKKREIASLVIGEGIINGYTVSVSAMAPFGSPQPVVISISGEGINEETLTYEANRLFSLLEVELQG